MHTLLTVMSHELTDHHYVQLREASSREFRVRLPAKQEMSHRLYFLLIEAETDTLLASGFLKPVAPVLWKDKTFSFLNIGGIIANEKGKGYGKLVVKAIRDYLIASDAIGLGFCFPNNQSFYEKCGLKVNPISSERFIYRNGNARITAGGQYVLYQDNSNRFLEKALADGDQEIFVPDPSIW